MINPASFDMRYTLCFLTRGNLVLMLHREKPPNLGLWNGVGGRIEPGESPRACILREVREETGFILPEITYSGILTWDGFETPRGGLYLYTAVAPAGEPHDCVEGMLAWKPREWIFSSSEVVSNIHIFGPLVLNGSLPRQYHFWYQDGKIVHYETRPLSDGWFVA